MPLRPPGSVFRAPAFGLEVEPPKPRRSGQEQRQAELAYDLPSPDAPFRFERLGPETQLLEYQIVPGVYTHCGSERTPRLG